MENILKQIVNNTEPGDRFQLFKPPIQLDKNKDYEIALINLETHYSFPDID